MKHLFLTFMLAFALYQSQAQKQELSNTVRGRIVDQISSQSLVGATIVILNSQPLTGVTTDIDGNFRLPNVPIGRYSFQVSFVGYEALTIPDILVTSGKEVILNAELKPLANSLEEVVINSFSRKDKPLNTMASVSARSFSVEETRRYAGGLDDPARMATAFAGVVAGGDMQDNALSIRGNAPRNVSWRLEGVDIPNPNHFAGGNVAGGGFISLLSSQMLTNSDFFTSAFPAEYGNCIGGVFDIKMRTGNNEKRESTFQIGVIGIDFASEGPFVKGKNATYLFNYRYSTMGLMVKAGIIPTEQIPQYQDLSFKINLPTAKAGVFSLWGIGGMGYNHQPVTADSSLWVTPWNRIKYDWNINPGAIGFNHKYFNGKNTNFSTTLSASGLYDKWDFTRLDNELVERPHWDALIKNSTLTLAHSVNHRHSSRLSSKSGVNYKRLFYNTKVSGTLVEEIPESFTNVVNEKGNDAFIEAYSQFKFELSQKFTINVGLHANYFQLNHNYSIEPRLSFNWNFHENHSFALGYGKHSQLEELKLYFVKVKNNGQITQPNKDLDFTKSHHFVISHDWSITPNLRLKTEPYIQFIYDAPGIPDSSYSTINFRQEYVFSHTLQNNSKGRNIGIDFTLERFFHKNYYYLLTASVFDSQYMGGDGVWRNTLYNRNFACNLLLGKDFYLKKNRNILSVNLKTNVMGGPRTSPMLKEASLAARQIVLDYTRLYEEQHPVEVYGDISISYRMNKTRYSSVWSLQVKNFTANKTSRGLYYDYRTRQLEEEKFTVVVPVLSYKIEF